jgi:mRNA interferase MazF
MKDFDEWNEIKKKTNKRQNVSMIKEGEICWCKIGLNIGNETIGKGREFSRPVLIIKKFSSDVFWGIPITSKKKIGNWYHYLENQNKTLIMNQMKLFDRKRLQSKIAQIPSNQVQEIKLKIISLLKS